MDYSDTKAQFISIRSRASNITSPSDEDYTKAMFFEDFPQFTAMKDDGTGTMVLTSHVPESVLEQFIDMANDAILKLRWFEKWRYGCGLYVAHFSSLYLKSYSETPLENPQDVASLGDSKGVLASASLGDASVSFSVDAVSRGTELWGSWNSTIYGQQLAALARILAIGGTYAV